MEQDKVKTPLIFRNYIRWPLMIAMIMAVLLGLAYIFLIDPDKSTGLTLPCYTYKTLGIYCPGCGDTRALHALTHGHILKALDYNALFPFFVLIGGWYYLVGLTTLFFKKRVMWIPESIPVPAAIGLGVVVVLFTVLRNLPVWPFSILAP